MLASYKVKDSLGNTAGFMIDGKFYTDYTVKDNIEYISNLELTENGIIKAPEALPEISYAEGVNIKRYEAIKEQNPFVRDIQKGFAYWKNSQTNTVLQLEGTRQIGKTTDCAFLYLKNMNWILWLRTGKGRCMG